MVAVCVRVRGGIGVFAQILRSRIVAQIILAEENISHFAFPKRNKWIY